MNRINKILGLGFTIALFSNCISLFAQDELNDLDKAIGDEVVYTAATFKSTHIINGHSIENMKKNQLDFRINHRFGQLNSGLYELFGLDNALINFSLDYGVTDNLMVGIRRGTYEKSYDGSLKYILFRQSTGKKNFPVTIDYYTDMSVNTLKITDPTRQDKFQHRLAFTHQLLVARKMGEKLSLQLSPSFVHRNQVASTDESDVYACGFGGRYKLTRRLSLTWEYFYSTHISSNYNPLALGFDLETGGHVFQLFLTNSRAMVEKGFIAETNSSFKNGGIFFGFNISRVFALGKNKTI
jgi:hypothetical protein